MLYPLDLKAEATFRENVEFQKDLEVSNLVIDKLEITDITPVNAVASSLTTALAGGHNDLVFTAKIKGVAGDDITIAYIDPAANDEALEVVVTGKDIVVNLETDGSGVITTIASDIITAIEALPAADALVSVVDAAGNNGSGLVIALVETPLAGGVNGTVGVANQTYFDGDYLYIATDTNTIVDANWKRITASTF